MWLLFFVLFYIIQFHTTLQYDGLWRDDIVGMTNNVSNMNDQASILIPQFGSMRSMLLDKIELLEYYCYSIRRDAANVCSGHGKCLANNYCDCSYGYFGNKCQRKSGDLFVKGAVHIPRTYNIEDFSISSSGEPTIYAWPSRHGDSRYPTLILRHDETFDVYGYVPEYLGDGGIVVDDNYQFQLPNGPIDQIVFSEKRVLYAIGNDIFCLGDNRDGGCYFDPAQYLTSPSQFSTAKDNFILPVQTDRYCVLEVMDEVGVAVFAGSNEYGQLGVHPETLPTAFTYDVTPSGIACSPWGSYLLNGSSLLSAGLNIVTGRVETNSTSFEEVHPSTRYVYAVQDAPMVFFISENDRFYGFGVSNYGIISDSYDETFVNQPTELTNGFNVKNISASPYLLLVLREDNTLYCRGAIGLCSNSPGVINVLTSYGWDFVEQVVAFSENIAFLQGTELRVIGSKATGLRRDELHDRLETQSIPEVSDVQQVKVTPNNTYYLNNEGNFYGFGYNMMNSSIPYTPSPILLSNAISDFAVSDGSVILRTLSNISGWGKNTHHELGKLGEVLTKEMLLSFTIECNANGLNTIVLFSTDSSFACLNQDQHIFAFAGNFGANAPTNDSALIEDNVRDAALDEHTKYILKMDNTLLIRGADNEYNTRFIESTSVGLFGELYSLVNLTNAISPVSQFVSISASKDLLTFVLLSSTGRVYFGNHQAFSNPSLCSTHLCEVNHPLYIDNQGKFTSIQSDYYFHYLYMVDNKAIIVPNMNNTIGDVSPPMGNYLPPGHSFSSVIFMEDTPIQYSSTLYGGYFLNTDKWISP